MMVREANSEVPADFGSAMHVRALQAVIDSQQARLSALSQQLDKSAEQLLKTRAQNKKLRHRLKRMEEQLTEIQQSPRRALKTAFKGTRFASLRQKRKGSASSAKVEQDPASPIAADPLKVPEAECRNEVAIERNSEQFNRWSDIVDELVQRFPKELNNRSDLTYELAEIATDLSKCSSHSNADVAAVSALIARYIPRADAQAVTLDVVAAQKDLRKLSKEGEKPK